MRTPVVHPKYTYDRREANVPDKDPNGPREVL